VTCVIKLADVLRQMMKQMMLERQILTSVSPLSHAETRYRMLILIKSSNETHLVTLKGTEMSTFDARAGNPCLWHHNSSG